MENYIEHLVDNTLKKENAKEIISERISWYEMQLKGKQEEIERLNKGLEYMKLYWSNREEYEKNELLNQIRDKDTSVEWLERAIEEEKKRERLH